MLISLILGNGLIYEPVFNSYFLSPPLSLCNDLCVSDMWDRSSNFVCQKLLILEKRSLEIFRIRQLFQATVATFDNSL